VINAGDAHGTLKGSRLDEVERFELKGARFVPAKLTRANEQDELRVAVKEADPPPLQPKERLVARVALKDGRILELPTTVQDPRPKVTLVSKTSGPAQHNQQSHWEARTNYRWTARFRFCCKRKFPINFRAAKRLKSPRPMNPSAQSSASPMEVSCFVIPKPRCDS